MLNERKLTKAELNKREDIVKDMKKNKRALVKKYGKDAEQVMYGRATKMAKQKTESMNQDKLREMIQDALQNPKKADLNKDGKLSDYEEKRGVAIEKSMAKEGTLTEDKQEAFDELQMIMEQLYELSDQAKMIFRNNFPGEYRRLDAYGALDFGTSSNRYDVTLEGALENLDMEDDDEDMMQEDLDLGHQDNEPHMLKADLYRIGKYAMELYQMLDKFEAGSEEVDLPHWWQSKIIKSKDAIVGAKHYLDFEIKEPQIDAMVDVASEEDAIDENYAIMMAAQKAMAAKAAKDKDKKSVKEGTWSVGTPKEIKNVMGLLDVAMDIKDSQELIDHLNMHNKSMYNIVGDDSFHDSIDSAKSEAKEGNMDRAQNNLSDAYGRAQFFLEREMDREGLKEEEAGEADMVASDIQKAMNAVKGDEAKTHQLKKARTAMNKGDLEKAKKIADRIAKMLKNK